MSSNLTGLKNGSNPNFIPIFDPSNPLNAGILINDVAVDPDTGDAYFSDSPNCRENSACDCLSRDLAQRLQVS